MMKITGYFILFMLITTVCFGQLSVVINSDTLQIQWNLDMKDENGAYEDSLYCKVFVQIMNTQTIALEQIKTFKNYRQYTTITDKVLFSELTDASYRVGVQTYDIAGNYSDILWSNEQGSQSWYIRKDFTNPNMPINLRH